MPFSWTGEAESVGCPKLLPFFSNSALNPRDFWLLSHGWPGPLIEIDSGEKWAAKMRGHRALQTLTGTTFVYFTNIITYQRDVL